jgi:hypothetical protein
MDVPRSMLVSLIVVFSSSIVQKRPGLAPDRISSFVMPCGISGLLRLLLRLFFFRRWLLIDGAL